MTHQTIYDGITLLQNNDIKAWNRYVNVNPDSHEIKGIFHGVEFDNANLKQATIKNATFYKSIFLDSTHITKASFKDCTFKSCEFKVFNFGDLQELENIKFIKCTFDNCTFKDLQICKRLNFQKCDIDHTDFSDFKGNRLLFNYGEIEAITTNERTNFINASFYKTETFRSDLDKIRNIKGITPDVIYSIILKDISVKIKLEFGGYKTVTHLLAITAYFLPFVFYLGRTIFTDFILKIFDFLPCSIRKHFIHEHVWGIEIWTYIRQLLSQQYWEVLLLFCGVVFYIIRIWLLKYVIYIEHKYKITGLDEAHELNKRSFKIFFYIYRFLYLLAISVLFIKLCYILIFVNVRF